MKTMTAMLGGAIIGAGAALLLAPQSGRATRAAIRDRSMKLGNDVQEFASGKTEHLKNKMKGISHELGGMIRHQKSSSDEEISQEMTATGPVNI